MKVGYIGLGDIGTPIAERILKQGLDLTLWNRTRGKMTPFVTAGASAAASPSDLARRSEIVALCVDSAEAIEQILFGSEGLVCALDKPRLVVDHSTIHPRAGGPQSGKAELRGSSNHLGRQSVPHLEWPSADQRTIT